MESSGPTLGIDRKAILAGTTRSGYGFTTLVSALIGFQQTVATDPFIWQNLPVRPSTTEKCSGPAE